MFNVFQSFYVKTSIIFYYNLFRLVKIWFLILSTYFIWRKLLHWYMSAYISTEWGFPHAIHFKIFENRLENTEESKGKVLFCFFKHFNTEKILSKVIHLRHSLTDTLRFNMKIIECSHFSISSHHTEGLLYNVLKISIKSQKLSEKIKNTQNNIFVYKWKWL